MYVYTVRVCVYMISIYIYIYICIYMIGVFGRNVHQSLSNCNLVHIYRAAKNRYSYLKMSQHIVSNLREVGQVKKMTRDKAKVLLEYLSALSCQLPCAPPEQHFPNTETYTFCIDAHSSPHLKMQFGLNSLGVTALPSCKICKTILHTPRWKRNLVVAQNFECHFFL